MNAQFNFKSTRTTRNRPETDQKPTRTDQNRPELWRGHLHGPQWHMRGSSRPRAPEASQRALRTCMVLSAMMIGLRLDNQNGMRETGRTHGSQWSSEKCHGCYFAPSSWALALSSRPASHPRGDGECPNTGHEGRGCVWSQVCSRTAILKLQAPSLEGPPVVYPTHPTRGD